MKRIAFFLLLSLSLSTSAMAQQRGEGNRMDPKEMAERRAQALDKRTDRMAKQMKLDDSKKAWFKQQYAELQDTLRHFDSAERQIMRKVDAMKLSADEASKKVDELQKNDEQKQQIRREYLKKLKNGLTPQQYLFVYNSTKMGDAMQRQQGQRPQGQGQRPGMRQGGMQGGPGMGGFGGGMDD